VLRRKVFDAVQFVPRFDPAIDHASCDYDAYVDSGYDLGKLKTRNGDLLTMFSVAPLTFKQKSMVDVFDIDKGDPRRVPGDLPMGRKARLAVIQFGLRGVENYEIETVDGSTKKLGGPERKKDDDLGPIVTDKWIETANLCADEIEAVARCIWEISEARPLSSTRSSILSGDGDCRSAEAAMENTPS
jgi:hypothetical protein